MEPLMITRQQLMEMCNCSGSALARYIRQGVLPGPVGNTKRWYVPAVKHRLAKQMHMIEDEDDEVSAVHRDLMENPPQ